MLDHSKGGRVVSGFSASCSFAVIASTILLALPAHAQTPQEALASGADSTEIIVTANRRDERLIDAPLTVNVVSPENLIESGARNLGDYLYTVPGVNYAKDGREGRGDITIRGLTSGNLATPMVSTYVDDVPIGSTTRFADGVSAYDQRLLDLGRIEILKGPQGTLYGASAMGGVVRYLTNRPDPSRFKGSAQGELSTTVGGAANYTLNAVLNAPINSNAAVRVAGFYAKDGGHIDATGPAAGKNVNGTETYGARASVAADLGEAVKVMFSAQYQKSDQDGTSYVDYSLATGQPLVGTTTRAGLRSREPQRQENQLYSLVLDGDLGFAKLTSITGYQRQVFTSRRDFGSIYSVFAGFFPPFIPITAAEDRRRANLSKWTQEVRLTSPSGRTLEWIVGAFYANEKGGIAQDIVQSYATPAPTGTPLLFGPGAGFVSRYEEIAGYATVNLNLSKRFTLTGGIRVSENKQRVLQINGGILAPGPTDLRTSKDSPITYTGTATFKIDPQNNLYARVATGYRAGGPNLGLVDPLTGRPLTTSPIYGSDTLISYELGYKGRLPGNVVNWEAALYQLDWSNIQQVIFSNGSAAISNFGKALIKGAELSVNLRPVDGVRFGGSLSVIDARLRTDSPVGLQAVAGSRLPNSAELSGNLNARYDFDISEATRAFIQVDQNFTGARNASFDRQTTAFGSRPNFVLPAFRQTDVTVGVDFERFKISAYARNVFDTKALLAADTTQAPFGLSVLATPIRPRTIGIVASANF
jgi:iron complex outermembrane recepter protein